MTDKKILKNYICEPLYGYGMEIENHFSPRAAEVTSNQINTVDTDLEAQTLYAPVLLLNWFCGRWSPLMNHTVC